MSGRELKIKAGAGAVQFDAEGNPMLVLIRSNGSGNLMIAKGKLEFDGDRMETSAEAARREFFEEAGADFNAFVSEEPVAVWAHNRAIKRKLEKILVHLVIVDPAGWRPDTAPEGRNPALYTLAEAESIIDEEVEAGRRPLEDGERFKAVLHAVVVEARQFGRHIRF